MKRSVYLDRAVAHSDPRYLDIYSRLGYERRDMRPHETGPVIVSGLQELRAEYQRIVGKKPFHGWGEAVLRSKISEHMRVKAG